MNITLHYITSKDNVVKTNKTLIIIINCYNKIRYILMNNFVL